MAMDRIYNWKRFWCLRGASILLTSDGFLYDLGKYNKEIVTVDSITNFPCLVLLGEPGMGKSHVLKAEWQRLKAATEKDGGHSFRLDLRSFSSEDRLVTSLFGSTEFVEWRDGNQHLHLFLDSLDECLLRIDTIATLLIDELKKYPVQRLSLFIACRSAEWPAVLEDGMRELWGSESVRVYELAPLRREDVVEAARTEGITNTEAFLREVAAKNAGPLAAKPVTLRLLLNLWLKNQQLPKTQAELYEQGCLLLCEEENPSRIAAGQKGTLSAPEKMVVAARIAAVTLFANRFAIWTDVNRGDCPEEDVTVQDLCGASERTFVRQFEVTEQAVREALATGLFSLRGANRLGWAHQTYAEFLAAWYLKHLKLDPAKIVRLITHAQDPEGRIAPQLHEVSAWIAGMFPDVFHHLMRTDTMVLLRSDVASADASARSQLTTALLTLFAEEKERDHWEIRNHYNKLKHPDLASQLHPFITDRNHNVVVRRAAIDIAEECRITELQNELAGIALDKSENLIVRIQAAAAVGEIGDSDTKARLKPLALGLTGNDPENELRGYGLIAVWPEHMAAEELFSNLVAPNDWYHGSYWVFLSQHLVKHLRLADLPIALRWIENQGARQGLGYSFGRVVDEILALAWHHLSEPGVLEAFSKVALRRLKAYEEIVEDHYPNELLKEFIGSDEKRCRVLKMLFPHVDNPDEDWIWFTHSDVFSVSGKDILWLLEILQTSIQPNEHLLLVRLIDRVIGNGEIPPGVLSAVQAGCEVCPLLAAAMEPRFKAVELGSPEAARMKESWEEMMKWQQRWESRKEESPLLEPPPAERIAHLLDKFESDDLDAWWRLNLEMTLEPRSTHYGSEIESDLTKLPGWTSADAQTRERIITAARKYLLEGDPKTSEWQGTSTLYRPAYAGYRALLLLMRLDPDLISRLPVSVWRKWIPIIVTYPIYSGIDSREEAIHRGVTSLAYQKASDVVIESLIIDLNKANADDGYVRVPDKFADCWDEQFKKPLREKVRNQDFKLGTVGNLMSQLLEHGDRQTQVYAESLITFPLPSEDVARKRVLIATRELMRHCVETSWSVVWMVMQQDTELGRSVIESLADNPNDRGIQASLTEEAQADLYIWVARQYPHREDPDTRGVHSVGTREAISQWRDSILQYLKEHGTTQSLTAIEKIKRELPELEWMKWVLNETRSNVRRRTWAPLQPKEIIVWGKEEQLKQADPGEPDRLMKVAELSGDILIWNSKPINDNQALMDFLELYRKDPDGVVPFVGAGLSRPLFPAWSDLLRLMVRKCVNLGKLHYDEDELLKNIEYEKDFLDIAECCVEALGENGYRDFLQEHFDRDFDYEEIPLAYRELLQLSFRTILTTNYDRIPDIGGRGKYSTYTHKTAGEARRKRRDNNKMVMKLHGDITRHDSIILTRSDYDQVIFTPSDIKDFLHGILETKTLLFIGFGLTDPHLMHILSGLKSISSGKSLTHYALMGGLTSFQVNAKERNFGIRIIKYEPSDPTHPEVLQFIRLLASN